MFTLADVFQQGGEQVVEDTIGVDATGQVFNSIVAVEQKAIADVSAALGGNPYAVTPR